MQVFFSYSHQDESLRDELETHLSMLKRQGLIDAWHDRRISAGSDLHRDINGHVENDQVILLLVSPNFLASDYCYEKEMLRAMERHEEGSAVVIPVILRPCDWHDAPFGKLMASPKDGKAITLWANADEAFLDVVKSIKGAISKFGTAAPEYKAQKPQFINNTPPDIDIRSSNLRVKKSFNDRDRDRFKIEAFNYIEKYFSNSLDELENRNENIECEFRKIDANRFTASIYQGGMSSARCTIFMGGDSFMGRGIAFIYGETTDSNSYNESLGRVDKRDSQTTQVLIQGCSLGSSHGSWRYVGCGMGVDRTAAAI